MSRGRLLKILFSGVIGFFWGLGEPSLAMVNSESVTPAGNDPKRAHEDAVLGVQLLNREGDTISFCTSVLVADDAILLAGHCFDKNLYPSLDSVRVHLKHDLRNLTKDDVTAAIKVVRAFSHPEYDSKAKIVKGVRTSYYDNDLAIAFLDRPVSSLAKNIKIKPQKLAASHESMTVGMNLTVYGFGRSVDWGDAIRTEAGRRTYTRQRGSMIVSGDSYGDRQLTTRNSKSHSCQGDSGGPAFLIQPGQDPVVVGVNSASAGDLIGLFRKCNGSTLLRPIASSRAWIDKTLSESRR